MVRGGPGEIGESATINFMQIKILQLNINGLQHEDKAKELLQRDYDILCFQEVTGKDTIFGNIVSKRDVFEYIQELLGPLYTGELAVGDRISSHENAYEGIAIIYKKEFTLLGKDILWLNKRQDPFPSDAKTFEAMSRNVLRLTLEKDTKSIDVLTTHLAWAPTPEELPHQTEQNTKIIEYTSTLSPSFLLAGDFNLTSDQPTITKLEQFGQNLTKDFGITNTLDPLLHHAWERIKPGIAVDYIFASKDVLIKEFQVLENLHVSDHFALEAIVEI